MQGFALADRPHCTKVLDQQRDLTVQRFSINRGLTVQRFWINRETSLYKGFGSAETSLAPFITRQFCSERQLCHQPVQPLHTTLVLTIVSTYPRHSYASWPTGYIILFWVALAVRSRTVIKYNLDGTPSGLCGPHANIKHISALQLMVMVLAEVVVVVVGGVEGGNSLHF